MVAQAKSLPQGQNWSPTVGGRRRRRLSLTGRLALGLLIALFLATVLGPLLWTYDPLAQNLTQRTLSPSLAHPFGTDRYGRDMLARLLVGGRWSLLGALIVCFCTSALGFLLGSAAAMSPRWVDLLLSRVVDAALALPSIVLALALTTVLPASFGTLLFALIITGWPRYARMYRTLLLSERQAVYVEAAAAIGCTSHTILWRHLFPNVAGTAIVLATSNFGGIILALASLSFLGFGIQAPTPEWGAMINDARPYFQTQPLQMLAPGLGIGLTVLAVNLLGDALRDWFDPRIVTR